MTAQITNIQETVMTRFARRTGGFGDSIWTEILTQFGRHDNPVYFGDGSPASELIPVERLREASDAAWNDGPAALGYGDQKGYEPLRTLIADRMRPLGIDTGKDNILVTCGSSQGIDLACRVLLEPGDGVIVENPTFLGALETFATYEVEQIGVETDAQGMRMDALERTLAANPHIRMIYTIPTFQNPGGSTMPADRRRRMAELARKHNVVILEDDPYGELRYDGVPVPPVWTFDPEVAIYLGTFSKTIAPGVRTGWMVALPAIMRLLVASREVIDISNDRIMMRTIYHASIGFLDDHVSHAITLYRSRRDAMLDALETHMPEGVTWSRPEGGFFVWITFPDHIRTADYSVSGSTNGVIFFPGLWFFADQSGTNHLRLSYSTVPVEQITLGVQRIADTFRDAVIRSEPAATAAVTA